ncbi:MAG: DUF3800 domain-containing protein [Chloroflexi bacterium]|nr:DUF3800 domain-containing protein [Chloroflexota bacterium]
MGLTDAPPRLFEFEDRYRLYLDESGDHVFRDFANPAHRFLCLLGCWFRNPEYLRFHEALESLKRCHLPHHPDDPAILHREDMINARREFKVLRDDARRAEFDKDLLNVIQAADFRVVAVIIDKATLYNTYGDAAAHPYHLGLGFLLQRYAGYLNHINRVGDVMAEARGGKEDRLLADSYSYVFTRGVWMTRAESFQRALTSRELKLKQKKANISGLQLADLLGHPVKQWALKRAGLIEGDLGAFCERLMRSVETKFNRHLYDNRLDGYGVVIYPKQ